MRNNDEPDYNFMFENSNSNGYEALKEEDVIPVFRMFCCAGCLSGLIWILIITGIYALYSYYSK